MQRFNANTPNQAKSPLHSLEQVPRGIGPHVNAKKTEYVCLDQEGAGSVLVV